VPARGRRRREEEEEKPHEERRIAGRSSDGIQEARTRKIDEEEDADHQLRSENAA